MPADIRVTRGKSIMTVFGLMDAVGRQGNRFVYACMNVTQIVIVKNVMTGKETVTVVGGTA